jgi:hypothetical protein
MSFFELAIWDLFELWTRKEADTEISALLSCANLALRLPLDKSY